MLQPQINFGKKMNDMSNAYTNVHSSFRRSHAMGSFYQENEFQCAFTLRNSDFAI